MNVSLRTHLLPVGDDDPARVVQPAIHARVERVYFLLHESGNLFEDVYHAARDRLLRARPMADQDMVTVRCDFYDLAGLLQRHGEIIQRERAAGNSVFVNISTGGKLNAVTGMLASMMFGARAYFCVKDFRATEIPDPAEVLEFPRYRIAIPSRALVTFLHHADEYMRRHGLPDISKKECLAILKTVDPAFQRSHRTSADYNKLKFRYLDKLEAEGLVSIEPRRRGKVSLTPEGRFALRVFWPYYEQARESE